MELSGSLPLDFLLRGLAVEWHGQLWDIEAAWTYAPRWTGGARVRYHDVFFETRNLEVWGDIGVQARDRMSVPDPAGGFEVAPVYQNWFARVQVRVVTVRLFVHWDNVTFREANQDIPGRVLPQTRVMYGVRWTLWN
jgi:hypothetical protein